jgi:hypothetical protein
MLALLQGIPGLGNPASISKGMPLWGIQKHTSHLRCYRMVAPMERCECLRKNTVIGMFAPMERCGCLRKNTVIADVRSYGAMRMLTKKYGDRGWSLLWSDANAYEKIRRSRMVTPMERCGFLRIINLEF